MFAILLWVLTAQGVIGTPFRDVQAIAEALVDAAPPGLKNEGVWKEWSAKRDRDIRARLVQGDEDSLANLLMMGTSFTRQPRVTRDVDAGSSVVQARIADLVRAMENPGNNERLLFMRRLVESKGYKLGDARLTQYLKDNLTRVVRENTERARDLASIMRLRSPSQQFAERSKLYRDRGLSIDTSLRPDLAIEESLAEMKARGLLAPNGVRKVAVIGPGLDFIDKNEGNDFYPPQTLQPFAVIDSLIRLGLAKPGEIEVSALDISPRVLDHLARARRRAQTSFGYTVELPRDTQIRWKPATVDYWQRFGDQIGSETQALPLPAGVSRMTTRAVRIRPSVVLAIQPVELNLILQRADPSPGYDLIIATNVFVYYDAFEQCLALRNVEAMLRPGGFLLSNNALPELPAVGMRSVDYKTTIYSDKLDDGDHVVWYRKD